jgi:hypothetical protein
MPVNSPTPTLDTAATTTHGGELSRSLGVGGNVLITLSGISPASSVFILGGAALAGYGTGVFWGFALAGVISLLIAFCYAELASRHPIAGGDYSLVSRVLGPAAGSAVFFIGLVSLPLIVAIFALGVADYLGVAIAGLDPLATALVVIVLATVTACFNIRTNAWVTGAFLVVELGRTGPARRARARARGASAHRPPRPAGARRRDGRARAPRHRRPRARRDAGHLLVQRLRRRGVLRRGDEERRSARSPAPCCGARSSRSSRSSCRSPPCCSERTRSRSSSAPRCRSSRSWPSRAGAGVTVGVLIAIALAIINAIIAIALQSGRLLFAAARDGAMPERIATPLARVSHVTRMPVAATVVMGVLALAACFIPFDVLLNATGRRSRSATGSSHWPRWSCVARAHGGAGTYRMPLWPLPPLLAVVAIAPSS